MEQDKGISLKECELGGWDTAGMKQWGRNKKMLLFCKGFQALKLPFRKLPSIQDKDVLIKYHLSFLLQAQLLVALFRSVRALFRACYI